MAAFVRHWQGFFFHYVNVLAWNVPEYQSRDVGLVTDLVASSWQPFELCFGFCQLLFVRYSIRIHRWKCQHNLCYIKPIQLELWNSVMKSGYAILELNFKTGSEFRTVLYGKNFQVFSRKTLFEKQKTWWFVSIHLCICAHVEVPLSSSLVEVWLAKNYVNIVIITKMDVDFFKITVIF